MALIVLKLVLATAFSAEWPCVESDQKFGHVPKVNCRESFAGGVFQTDGFGFRRAASKSQKKSHKKSVVVVGRLLASLKNSGQGVHSILQRELERQGTLAEVFLASPPGFELPRSLIYLAGHMREINPDFVVVYIHHKEIWDIMMESQKLKLDSSELRIADRFLAETAASPIWYLKLFSWMLSKEQRVNLSAHARRREVLKQIYARTHSQKEVEGAILSYLKEIGVVAQSVALKSRFLLVYTSPQVSSRGVFELEQASMINRMFFYPKFSGSALRKEFQSISEDARLFQNDEVEAVSEAGGVGYYLSKESSSEFAKGVADWIGEVLLSEKQISP